MMNLSSKPEFLLYQKRKKLNVDDDRLYILKALNTVQQFQTR